MIYRTITVFRSLTTTGHWIRTSKCRIFDDVGEYENGSVASCYRNTREALIEPRKKVEGRENQVKHQKKNDMTENRKLFIYLIIAS